MYKLRPFLPFNVLKNVYYSLIYSHIIYMELKLGDELVKQSWIRFYSAENGYET